MWYSFSKFYYHHYLVSYIHKIKLIFVYGMGIRWWFLLVIICIVFIFRLFHGWCFLKTLPIISILLLWVTNSLLKEIKAFEEPFLLYPLTCHFVIVHVYICLLTKHHDLCSGSFTTN